MIRVSSFRFSPQAKQDRHPCVFLPFGIGQRKCPGFKIARVKVKLAIVAILRKYTIHRSQHTEVSIECYHVKEDITSI